MGREFQLWGPAIENARSPAFMKVRGTTRLGCERRPSRLGLLKSSMSEMYGGKMLVTVLYMFSAVLKNSQKFNVYKTQLLALSLAYLVLTMLHLY